ncbi:MAG TPA: ATPase domain-containing protein [Usitatibacter sp.]|nr:ATPase domain-containing protein [Usitatibacter sp.]
MAIRGTERAPTGVAGLDQILHGGLPSGRLYLVDGSPGVGKTTLALQFLLEGVRRGESCLYVTLSETRDELEQVADSHGWSLEGISIIEMSQIERALMPDTRNTLFQVSDLQLNALVDLLVGEFRRLKPQRMVLDSLSEMRLMAQNPLRYRRQILALKHVFGEANCTTVLLDDRSAQGQDIQVQSIVHGMISLQIVPLKYGINRRYLTVTKLRGSNFREGNHDYIIRRGGMVLFPRLVAAEHPVMPTNEAYSSGNEALDRLVGGGGLHAGTGTLLLGPAGSGKSTVASMFASNACSRGKKVVYFAFDEVKRVLVERSRAMGLRFDEWLQQGLLQIHQVDPADVAPGELAARIVHAVEVEKVSVIVLDSLNGYVNAMPQEEFLHLHLHELLSYVNQRGVMTIMILAQTGLVGPMGAPVEVSYLADTVMLTRFFEARGSLKKAISVVKKRSGPHEDTIREMSMSAHGVRLGEPLVQFQGVLTGVPRFMGGELEASGDGM